MSSDLVFDLVAREKGFDTTMEAGAKSAEKLAKHLEDAGKRSGNSFAVAARGIGSTLEKIERSAWESGKGMDEAFTNAVRSMRSDFERLREAGRITGASLESEIGASLRHLKGQVDEFADEAGKSTKDLGEGLSSAAEEGGQGFGEVFGDQLSGLDFGGFLESALGKAGLGAGVGAGAALIGGFVADQIIEGFQHSMEQIDIGNHLALASGQNLGFARHAGELVGEAWEDGFGDTMEDVAESAGQVLAKGLAGTIGELDSYTRKVEVAGEVTGASAEQIASAVRAMVAAGEASGVNQAFDIIIAGARNGADAGGDLIDTFAESSKTLASFGIDGKTALGAFKQGLDAGLPSADTLTGALEELSGNAVDAIPIFRQLGLGGKEFADALVSGGPRAAAAVDQLFDRIRAIESPAERAAVMTQLFGEEATAMGDALTKIDFSAAAQGLGDISLETEKATQQFEAMQNPMESVKRSMIGMISDPFTQLWDMLTNPAPAEETESTASALDNVSDALTGANGPAEVYASHLNAIVDGMKDLADGAIGVDSSILNWTQSLQDANEAIRQNGENTDILTEKGHSNSESLLNVAQSARSVIDAMVAQSGVTQDVAVFTDNARAAFLLAADAAGYDAVKAQELADKYGLIPPTVPTDIVANDHASGVIDNIMAKMRDLDGTWAYTYVQTIIQPPSNRSGTPSDPANQGTIPFRAAGGDVDEDMPYFVGEKGMELFVPDSNGMIVPNDALTSSAGAFRPASWAGASAESGSRMDVNVSLAAGAGGDAGAGQWIQSLVRRGILKLTVDGKRVDAG